MIAYRLMYSLGFAPWERRPIEPVWQQLIDGPDALSPGRGLDVGCGTGRDAVYLAKRGWQMTGIDMVEKALAKAELAWIKTFRSGFGKARRMPNLR